MTTQHSTAGRENSLNFPLFLLPSVANSDWPPVECQRGWAQSPGNHGKGIFVNMGAEGIWRKLSGVSLWPLGFCAAQGSSHQQSRASAAPLSHWSLWISLPWGTWENKTLQTWSSCSLRRALEQRCDFGQGQVRFGAPETPVPKGKAPRMCIREGNSAGKYISPELRID